MLLGGTAAAQAPDAHYVAGQRYFKEGNFEKARDELKASIAARATSNAAIYLSNVYLKTGELELAKVELGRALKLEPTHKKKEAILALMQSIDLRSLARLVVQSSPPGAAVRVSSAEGVIAQGTTPFDRPLPAGPIKITAAIDGYEDVARDVTLEAGETTKLELPMRTKGCDVSLTASPAAARASLDGAAPVPVPATFRVPAGPHTLVLRADDFVAKDVPFQCDLAPVALTTSLVFIPPGGFMTIPDERGIVVTIDGAVVDATAAGGIRLLVGSHEVSITGPNRAPWTTRVEMGKDQKVTVEPPKSLRGFRSPAVYLGLEGGANLVLTPWNLGTNASVAANGTKYTPGTSGLAGLRVGVQVVPRLAIEAEVHWVGVPSYFATSEALSYDVNALVHVFRGGFTPIVEGGAGVYQVVSGGLGAEARVRGHLGIGYLGRLNDRFSLRVDVRDVLTVGFTAPADNIEVLGGAELVLWK